MRFKQEKCPGEVFKSCIHPNLEGKKLTLQLCARAWQCYSLPCRAQNLISQFTWGMTEVKPDWELELAGRYKSESCSQKNGPFWQTKMYCQGSVGTSGISLRTYL